MTDIKNETIRALDYLIMKRYHQHLNKARRTYLAIMKGGE